MFHRTSGKSRVSTLKTTKSTTTATTSKVLLKSHLKGTLPSGVKKVPAGKMKTKKFAAKGSSKGLTTTSKALASKAKNVSAKQTAKTVKAGKVPLKGTLRKVKQKMTLGFKSTAPKNQPDAEQHDPSNKEHVEVAKETDEDDKSTNKTAEGGDEIVTGGQVSAPEAETDSTAQVQLGGAAAEPMEVGSCAEAVAENPADRPSENRPSTSSVEAAPTETSGEVLPHDQQHTLSEPPESAAAASESVTDAPQVQQQAAVGELGTNTLQKGKLKIRWMVCVEIEKKISPYSKSIS